MKKFLQAVYDQLLAFLVMIIITIIIIVMLAIVAAACPFFWLARRAAFCRLSIEQREALKRLEIACQQIEINENDYLEFNPNQEPIYDFREEL